MCLLYSAPKALSLKCSSRDRGDQPLGLCLLCLDAAIFLASLTVHSVISSTECTFMSPEYCFLSASLSLLRPPVSPELKLGGNLAGLLIGAGTFNISTLADPISGKWSPMKDPSGETRDITFRELEMTWSITDPVECDKDIYVVTPSGREILFIEEPRSL